MVIPTTFILLKIIIIVSYLSMFLFKDNDKMLDNLKWSLVASIIGIVLLFIAP